MARLLSPGRLALAGLVLLGVVVAVLWATPSSSYIFLPDRAHSVEPLVTVKGGKTPTDGGGIYFVDVLIRKATLFERLFPGIHSGSTIVPVHAVRPPGVSEAVRRKVDRNEMSRSQEVAAAVALRELGYKVRAQPTGVLVDLVRKGGPSSGKLQAADLLTSVDGRKVLTTADLRRLVGRRPVGTTVQLGVRRDGELRRVDVRTAADPERGARPILGIFVEQVSDIRLPVPVRIQVGAIGGPSAGLAFALDVLEELGRDVDRGRRVAATGAIELDGRIIPIGGVRQKTIGVERSKIDVFLVPAGENAAEARRYAHDVRIIPVSTFQQALRALATLPEPG